MTEHLPVLIVFLPLLGALLALPLGRVSEGLAGLTMKAAMAGSFVSAAMALPEVLARGPVHYHLGGWKPPFGIEYVLDPLSCGMAVLVSFMGLLVSIYGAALLKKEYAGRTAHLQALFGLLACGLLGMVVTGDAFNLYVHLEISALSVYALVASGGDRATVAAFRYLILGTLGGTFYLLGVGYLYAVTGTLNMADLAARLPAVADSRVVVVAVALMVAGLGVKMALFPMHGWMPDAYSYSPPAFIGFIAGIMSKVAAYALLRLLYFVVKDAPVVGPALSLVGILAAAAIVAGSFMALAQKDFRRMLAYSSVAQVGYIAMGIAIGTRAALIGAMLHILNHAVMKTCLFFIAGGLRYRGESILSPDLVNTSRRMPLSSMAFVIAALSMVGLPPTAGFFSKWYLAIGALDAGAWPYVLVIAVSSLLNAVYFFRIVEKAYYEKAVDKPRSWGRLELPVTMLLPIVLLGVGILVLGVFSERVVSSVIVPALPAGMR